MPSLHSCPATGCCWHPACADDGKPYRGILVAVTGQRGWSGHPLPQERKVGVKLQVLGKKNRCHLCLTTQLPPLQRNAFGKDRDMYFREGNGGKRWDPITWEQSRETSGLHLMQVVWASLNEYTGKEKKRPGEKIIPLSLSHHSTKGLLLNLCCKSIVSP